MKRPSTGSIIVAATAVFPLMVWSLFSWRQPSLDTFGRLAGIFGLSLLSINIILSARLKIFDSLFHGLDRMYRVHHTIGCITLISLLIHSNLLILSYASISPESAFTFLTSIEPAMIAGRLGLLIMTSAMIVVLYINVKYQWFITAQRVLGSIIFLGGYHALFAPGSDIRTNTPLFIYMGIVGVLAASVFMYRSVFHKNLTRTYSYTIHAVSQHNKITHIKLRPLKQSLRHYAGQYAFVSFKGKNISHESHPYTISSGSDSTVLEFNIKELGDFTSTLSKLQVGDLVDIDGPYGQFSFTKIGGLHHTWIAGGIGITPFLSMARSIPSNLSVDLYYSITKPNEAIFLGELKEISVKHNNFRVHPIYTDKESLLTASRIQKVSGLGDKILLCGPPPMMKSLKNQLIQVGVKQHNIHYEEFNLA
jgi:predicted ferric reductase